METIKSFLSWVVGLFIVLGGLWMTLFRQKRSGSKAEKPPELDQILTNPPDNAVTVLAKAHRKAKEQVKDEAKKSSNLANALNRISHRGKRGTETER